MSDDHPAQDPRERLAELFAQRERQSADPRGNQPEGAESQGDDETNPQQPGAADHPAVPDPRERLAALFEQRSKTPPRPSGGLPRSPESEPEETTNTVELPQPASQKPAIPAGAVFEDVRAQLQDLDNRLSEAVTLERRLRLRERHLARQQELGGGPPVAETEPSPLPVDYGRADSGTPPGLASRLKELDRRLAGVAALEQRLARLEQQLAQRRPAPSESPAPSAASEPAPAGEQAPPIATPTPADAPSTPATRTPRTQRLVWMLFPLEALVLALIIVTVLSHRGIGQTAGPPPASSATAGAVAAAQGATLGAVAPTQGATATATVAAAAIAPTAIPSTAPTVASAAVFASTPTNSAPASGVASIITIGKSLCDLAVDSSGQHVYVSDDGQGQLLALDLAPKQVKWFALGAGASLCSIALDQQHQIVYVPTWRRAGPNKYTSSDVQAVNVAADTISTFADGQFPTGPYFDDHNQTLLVGNTAAPSLFTIDATTGATGTIDLPAKVNRLVRSSQNGDLYMASPDGNKVLVYDPATRTMVTTLTVGQRPWGVAADPKSGRVLVSSELSGSVSLIDPATNQIIRTTPTGSHPRNLSVDSANGRFYVLNTGDRTISAIDSDGRLLGTSQPLPGSEEPSGIAVASQSGQVFVISKTHIYILNEASI